jgi:hypothetical protein
MRYLNAGEVGGGILVEVLASNRMCRRQCGSSAEDIPRGMEFLYSRNRINVAVSRAQALSVMVASPKLLAVHCHTVDQMRLANVLCRYVEMT